MGMTQLCCWLVARVSTGALRFRQAQSSEAQRWTCVESTNRRGLSKTLFCESKLLLYLGLIPSRGGIDCDARQKRATSELLTLGVGSVWRTTPARSTRRRLGLAECAVSARADRDRADVEGAKTRRRRPVTSRDRDHGEFVAR